MEGNKPKVDKKVCLAIFRRGLRPNLGDISDFRGKAKDWRKFEESGFQKFAEANGIAPETEVSVYSRGNDSYAVEIL